MRTGHARTGQEHHAHRKPVRSRVAAGNSRGRGGRGGRGGR
jgi:hypothetical protein